MPYGITDKQTDCSGWATVKREADGSYITIGCHGSKQDAIDQMVAASIGEDIEPLGEVRAIEERAESYSPTNGMKEEAQRGLDWRAEHNRGGTAVGVARARDIINGKQLPIETVKRMRSYFARHEVDKQGQGWSPDEEGYPSAGRIAWALWGGDAGKTWADSIVKSYDGEEREVEMDEEENLTPRQQAQYETLEMIAEQFGMFDQGIGANGAHYVAESPFAQEGLICANCAFYEGGQACEIVAGQIDPEAICKLWIIDETLLSEAASAAVEVEVRERDERSIMLADMTASTVEHRWCTIDTDERRVAYTTSEVRASADGTTIVGYAAVFDSPSEPMPFTEFVRRGAFTKTLNDGADVRLLIDHEGVPLARTKSGTLMLEEDERGLRVEAQLDPTNPDAARVISAMKRGDISQMSFAFRTIKDSWSNDRAVRELKEVQLYDVSVVTFPAYEETVAELRKASEVATVDNRSTILLRKNQIAIAKSKQPERSRKKH